MHIAYYLWALLPLSLIIFGIIGACRTWTGSREHEPVMNYFKQGIYCALILVCAVIFDRSTLPRLSENTFLGDYDLSIVHWLLYPAFLTLAAYAQGRYQKSK